MRRIQNSSNGIHTCNSKLILLFNTKKMSKKWKKQSSEKCPICESSKKCPICETYKNIVWKIKEFFKKK